MGSIKSLSGIEMLKRLDEKLHIYGGNMLIYPQMEWVYRGTPRWILGMDMIEKLNAVFGDIYIHNGLQGILDSAKAEGIGIEDGQAILVKIKNCVECEEEAEKEE